MMIPNPRHTPSTLRSRFSTNFVAACIRALRTGIQVVVAGVPAGALTDVDWLAIINIAGLATLISFLQGVLTALPEVPDEPWPTRDSHDPKDRP